MKKHILTFFILAICIAGFAQQKNYVTKTISKWSLEKFPAHYYIIPAKANTDKDPFTGKILSYQELNNLGQSDGLFLLMQNNGANPYSATYTYKGQEVYSVIYFGNSNIASIIQNHNIEGLLDGPQITRTLKETGGYTEEIQIYENGVLKTVNGIKQEAFGITFNADSLLDGNFKFQNSTDVIYEGIAFKGKISYIKCYINVKNVGIGDILEVTIKNDSIFTKSKERLSDLTYHNVETYPIKCNAKFTNSKNIVKNNTDKDYIYIYFDKEFSISEFLSKIKLRKLSDMYEYKKAIDNLNENAPSSLQSLKEIATVYEKNLSSDDLNILNTKISECEKKISDEKAIIEKKFADKKAAIENAAKLQTAKDSLSDKKNELILLVSEQKDKMISKPKNYIKVEEYTEYSSLLKADVKYYRGQIIKKGYINIYNAFLLLLDDCTKSSNSLTDIKQIENQLKITIKFISINKSEDYKNIDKQLDGITDISAIKKIINLN